jgi:hypothetical protein
MLSVFMLSVLMLSVLMLNVVMLNVVAQTFVWRLLSGRPNAHSDQGPIL